MRTRSDPSNKTDIFPAILHTRTGPHTFRRPRATNRAAPRPLTPQAREQRLVPSAAGAEMAAEQDYAADVHVHPAHRQATYRFCGLNAQSQDTAPELGANRSRAVPRRYLM